jgi:hypothetical protein
LYLPTFLRNYFGMPMNLHNKCPACHRAFESVFDYPAIKVTGFEQLPIPEAIDDMSAAAAERRLLAMRNVPGTQNIPRAGGINLTPAIERACNKTLAQEYLLQLKSLVGMEVSPQALLPRIPPDRLFRRAYPIDDTGIYISVDDSKPNEAGERHAEVGVYCEGPNLGSAGGPTLQRLGAIAIVRYEGLLAEGVMFQPQ